MQTFRTLFARSRLLVGRTRLYAPQFGWRPAAGLAWKDRRGRSGLIEVDWPGYPAPFHLRAGGSDLLTFHQVIARDGYQMPFEVDVLPEVIIDAGANIGLSSIWYAQRYPSAKVIALEPEPANFEQLVGNVATYPNIVPLEAALWPTPGTVVLTDPSVGSFGFRTEAAVEGGRHPDAVRAVSVDSLIEEFGLGRIDILKIDIEGSEKELFEPIPNWIEHVDVIAIELHDRFKPGCKAAFDQATADFTIRSTTHDETFVRRPARPSLSVG